MKNSTPCPAAPASGTTVQHRLAAQCAAMLEEIRSTIPQAAQADFETPVFSALALLQLDARKHCLHQHDLLRLLYLQGVFHGAVFGLECAASKMNITDVTQSILQDMFVMIMMVEFTPRRNASPCRSPMLRPVRRTKDRGGSCRKQQPPRAMTSKTLRSLLYLTTSTKKSQCARAARKPLFRVFDSKVFSYHKNDTNVFKRVSGEFKHGMARYRRLRYGY